MLDLSKQYFVTVHILYKILYLYINDLFKIFLKISIFYFLYHVIIRPSSKDIVLLLYISPVYKQSPVLDNYPCCMYKPVLHINFMYKQAPA